MGGKNPQARAPAVQAERVSHPFLFSPRRGGKLRFPGEGWVSGAVSFHRGNFSHLSLPDRREGFGLIAQAPGLARAGRYSGYGSAEDTRDYYLHMKKLARRPAPTSPSTFPLRSVMTRTIPWPPGSGKSGVAVDTLRDMEIIFEPFPGRTTSTGPPPTSPSMPRPTSSWPCTWPWRTNGEFPGTNCGPRRRMKS